MAVGTNSATNADASPRRDAGVRVAVTGAGGRMGRHVCEAVRAADGCELVAAVDPGCVGDVIEGVTVTADIGAVADASANVVVDFTHPDVALGTIEWCVHNGVHAVVGTSGFTAARLASVQRLVGHGPPNVIVAPNFAIGAVLLQYTAEVCAPHFDRVEVIEVHHDGKADAPSGTAINTAERLDAAKARHGGWPRRGDSVELLDGESRGALVGGVRVHAVRLPGPIANQEVVFGAEGQTLTLRHDTFDRSSFMPGVILAVRAVASRPGCTVGLEPVLGLTPLG
jgi:4-hydroxy-tetrahydrodipicolinate reductase